MGVLSRSAFQILACCALWVFHCDPERGFSGSNAVLTNETPLMNRYLLLTLLLLLAHSASADQLDGLESLGFIVFLVIVAAISVLVLLISLFRIMVERMAEKAFNVSIGINASCTALISCSLLAMGMLGSQIDPGFRWACIGIIGVSIALIVLNYRLGTKRDENE